MKARERERGGGGGREGGEGGDEVKEKWEPAQWPREWYMYSTCTSRPAHKG